MPHSRENHQTSRDQRRACQRRDQRIVLRQRRWQRGQTLVIFAISLTMLIGLAGLTIDVARAYDLYARMQRAAEAGALAGVLYMPNYYSQATPAGTGLSSDSAVSRASQEIVKNGFGSLLPNNVSDCPPHAVSTSVTICPVPNKTDDLQVTLTQTLNVVLLSGLGVQPITLTATAQAEFLPTLQLGSRQNFFGDQVECYQNGGDDITNTHSCVKGDNNKSHLQYFMASIRGPATLKEYGDPMVYCEEGPSNLSNLDSSDTTADTTYNGMQSNHAQWGNTGASSVGTAAGAAAHCGQPGTGGAAGNADQQPAGYDGPATHNTAHPGGYNYEIQAPSSVSGATIWVYNPSFIPSKTLTSSDDNEPLDYLNYSTNGMEPWNSKAIKYNGSALDAPAFYFNITYTLYQVNNLYDRSQDAQVYSRTYPAYDGYANDVATHGCGGAAPAYDPYWLSGATPNSYWGGVSQGAGCVDLAQNKPFFQSDPAPCYNMWCQLGADQNVQLLPGHTYRLVVEATGLNVPASLGLPYASSTLSGAGNHSYALKVCARLRSGSPIGCTDGSGGGASNQQGVTVFGWNNTETNFSSPLAQKTPSSFDTTTTCVSSQSLQSGVKYTCMDLGCIPTAYAGRAINLNLFDPGDGSGDISVGIVPPANSGATVTYPSWVPLQRLNGVNVVKAGFIGAAQNAPSYNVFNGIWLDSQISLPSTYSGNCLAGAGATGWWQMIYATDDNAQPFDWLNISFALLGSPVHLVPPTRLS